MAPELRRRLEDQHARISSMPGMLTARDCWRLVSHHEHQVYGHNKHPLRIVIKSLRHIRAAYGANDNSGRDSCRSSAENLQLQRNSQQSSVQQSVGGSLGLFSRGSASASWAAVPQPAAVKTDSNGNLKASSRDNDMISLDLETFITFMNDDENHHVSAEEGGDTEYLRKALGAEQNDHTAEEARKTIAARYKDYWDPRPEGFTRVVVEHMPPPIIFANAIVLGLQSDIASPVWEVLEQFFLAFYLVEIAFKFRLLGCRRFFRGSDNRWNIFDLVNVFFSLVDLTFRLTREVIGDSQLSNTFLNVIQFLRLARLARIVKSFRSAYFDDLKVMSLGVLSGAKVLCWAVILFFSCVFVLGVVLKEILGHTEQEFGTVPASMFSVFRCFTDGCNAMDGSPLHERLRLQYGAFFMVPYILIFLVVNFGVFNLIVAVFIDRVVTTTVKTKQMELGQRENEMKVTIEGMLVGLVKGTSTPRDDLARFRRYTKMKVEAPDLWERVRDAQNAMNEVRAQKVQIPRELFNTWLTDPDLLALLQEVDIDTALKSEIFDVCDVDKSGSLTVDELVSGLMRLRGPISKSDIIAIRLKVRYLTKMLEDIHHTLNA